MITKTQEDGFISFTIDGGILPFYERVQEIKIRDGNGKYLGTISVVAFCNSGCHIAIAYSEGRMLIN